MRYNGRQSFAGVKEYTSTSWFASLKHLRWVACDDVDDKAFLYSSLVFSCNT